MADDIRDELQQKLSTLAGDGLASNPHPYDEERYQEVRKWAARLRNDDDEATLVTARASLEALAKTGWSLTNNDTDRERFAALIDLAKSIGEGGSFFGPPTARRQQVDNRLDSISSRYVTPKVGVGAVVDDGSGRLLMIQRADRGEWTVPGGYADVGLRGAEIATKEAFEETGYEVEVVALLGEWSNLHHQGQRIPQISLLYHCWVTGGSERRHPVETLDLQWFRRGHLPQRLWQDGDPWLEIALRAVEGVKQASYFDRVPRPAQAD